MRTRVAEVLNKSCAGPRSTPKSGAGERAPGSFSASSNEGNVSTPSGYTATRPLQLALAGAPRILYRMSFCTQQEQWFAVDQCMLRCCVSLYLCIYVESRVLVLVRYGGGQIGSAFALLCYESCESAFKTRLLKRKVSRRSAWVWH